MSDSIPSFLPPSISTWGSYVPPTHPLVSLTPFRSSHAPCNRGQDETLSFHKFIGPYSTPVTVLPLLPYPLLGPTYTTPRLKGTPPNKHPGTDYRVFSQLL
eukprot:754880-Hanusia_phi.AAC.1